MRLGDMFDNCQPQSGALARLLGREERNEYFPRQVLGHAWPVVGYVDNHVVAPIEAAADANASIVAPVACLPRIAEQVSVVFVLPIVGLFVAQSLGLIFINEQIILWMAVVLFFLDIGMLAFATQLFQRETILTRWK